jgi:ABC-2 type transport system permease protein
MSATLSIAQRDFKGFFGTPLGWIAACIIFLISGVVFFIVVRILLDRGQSIDPVSDIISQVLGFLNYINIFIIPAFTMKAMSEDLNNGTYRLQSAAPISTWEIVAGKFLGVTFYFSVITLLMLIYPLFTYVFTEPDLKVLATGWLGLILNTATIISIGLFIGSLTKNPVLSYLGSAFFIIVFIISGFIPGVPDWYRKSINLLDLSNDFSRGILKTGSVATYIAIVLVFLFLCRFVMEIKKWRI